MDCRSGLGTGFILEPKHNHAVYTFNTAAQPVRRLAIVHPSPRNRNRRDRFPTRRRLFRRSHAIAGDDPHPPTTPP